MGFCCTASNNDDEYDLFSDGFDFANLNPYKKIEYSYPFHRTRIGNYMIRLRQAAFLDFGETLDEEQVMTKPL